MVGAMSSARIGKSLQPVPAEKWTSPRSYRVPGRSALPIEMTIGLDYNVGE
jgi:hypothetical protein